MKFENTETWGFLHAIRGMRNPLESWDRSDSFICTDDSSFENCKNCRYLVNDECTIATFGECFVVGKNDIELMQKLIKAGSEHRKFMRQIFVSVDITAPLYWWKEFDTYKVGTVSNSCSTMHKLASTPITMDCFEMGDFEVFCFEMTEGEPAVIYDSRVQWQMRVDGLEQLRQKYNETKNKRYWKELIRVLPESWLQKRTVTMSYENVLNMVKQRKNHKLTEWSESFMGWARSLPYAQELLFLE